MSTTNVQNASALSPAPGNGGILNLPRSSVVARTSTRNLSAINVTQQFSQAVAGLKTGQLVKDESFSLFEAVSALEIGDAKMDSGCLGEGEALENEYDVTRQIAPEELIWIMDQLLCHEVAWHMGYPLSQTLFTSSYVDSLLWPVPKTLEDAQFRSDLSPEPAKTPHHLILRSFCLALVKACDFVYSLVTSQHYYEEEDFSSQLFHRELLHSVSCSEINKEVLDALSLLDSMDTTQDIKLAIESRLRCQQDVMRVFDGNAQLPQHHMSSLLDSLPLLREIENSAHLGSSVTESFSRRIQRNFASSVPPKPIVRLEYQEVFAYLVRLFRDSSNVHQIRWIIGNGNLMTAYWTFMTQTPQPSVYVRSLLQSFLSQNDKVLGLYSAREFIVNDLRRLILPASPLLDSSNDKTKSPTNFMLQARKVIDDFVLKCNNSYLNIFRTFCLNRCRIRRVLCHAVAEWDQLQADAEEFDITIRDQIDEQQTVYTAGSPPTYSYPLSSWMYHYKLLQMEKIVQMGFELSVYAPDELARMYWYLSHLCSIHIAHLKRMSFFAEKSARASRPFAGTSRTSGNSITKYKLDVENTLHSLYHIFIRVKATEALSRALHRIYTVLGRHGLVPKPPRPYASHQLRYEARMRPFLHLIIPEPLGFDTFEQELALEKTTDYEMLSDASAAATSAKKAWEEVLKAGWQDDSKSVPQRDASELLPETPFVIQSEWTADVKNSLRSCIGTSIAIDAVKMQNETTWEATGVRIPNVDSKDRWHQWWAVPRIQVVR